jgi:predicted metal-dependent peptidase
LRAHLSDRIKGDWSSFPFSKRLLHRGLFMPSPSMQVPGHVVFAIDTSGSMSMELLAGIVGELRAFREVFPCRLTVLQCDAALQSIETFDAMDGYDIPKHYKIHGRGGTDFCPVFDWVAQQPDLALVLYATDGMGTFPGYRPEIPVIWLHTPPHLPSASFPFGAVVKIAQP